MRRARLAAATLAVLGSAYAVAPGTAAASHTPARAEATGCTAGVENGGPEARLGGVARCQSGQFRVFVQCHTIVGSPASYYVYGPVVTAPAESWAYCDNYSGHVAVPASAMAL